MRVNLRGRDQDCTGCWWSMKISPDPMIVAQYEVLGLRFKELSVPDGTIDECWQSLSGVRHQKPSGFYRPLRDGRVFLPHFPALRTGLLSLSPSGTNPHRTILSP